MFGNASLNKNVALSQIGFWDTKERNCGLFLENSEARKRTVEEFSKWAVLEEISWRQKSRELWLKEGDKNSKFFHKMANARRRKNFFSSITVDVRKLIEETEIKEGVVNAFQNIVKKRGLETKYFGVAFFFLG